MAHGGSKMEENSTLIETIEKTYIVVGIVARCISEIEGIPHELISVNEKTGNSLTVENPEKELLILGPTGARNTEYGKKTLSLKGIIFHLGKVLSVTPIAYDFIEPTYKYQR